MSTNAVLFLARRYLRAKRSFLSIITIISILGVAVGVLMMIVVNAVMQGFEGEFRRALIGYQPHMLLRPTDGKPASPSAADAIWAKLRSRPEIQASTPYAGGIIYLERDGAQTGTELFGLPPAGLDFYMKKVAQHRLDGSLDLTDGTIVTSDMDASALRARPGDKFSIYPSSSVTDAVRRFHTAADITDDDKRKAAFKEIKLHPREIQLIGYTRGETAGHYAYATLATAQMVFGFKDNVTGILIELHHPDEVKAFHQLLLDQKLIPDGWQATLWTDIGDARLAAMSTERYMMFFILGIIGLVAAFAVMNTTITVTTQKRREIGVLTALGARQGQIVSIFVSQAAVVGFFGTLSGLLLSGIVLTYRNDIRGWIAVLSGNGSSDAEGLFLATIPAHIDPLFITVTCVASMAFCLLAALPPAWLASRVDPAVALRD